MRSASRHPSSGLVGPDPLLQLRIREFSRLMWAWSRRLSFLGVVDLAQGLAKRVEVLVDLFAVVASKADGEGRGLCLGIHWGSSGRRV